MCLCGDSFSRFGASRSTQRRKLDDVSTNSLTQIPPPRVGHGLRRLVLVGNDGWVSLAALRWLADQDAAFVMLERDGAVLANPAVGRKT